LAQVRTGTLFRYAHSKGELLCMAANEEFTAIVESVPATADPAADLPVLRDPLIAGLRRPPERGAAYDTAAVVRERGPRRAAAARILREVRRILGVILARRTGHGQDDPALGAPARTVFDGPYMEIARSGVDADPRRDHRAELRGHVDRVLHGVLPTLSGLR